MDDRKENLTSNSEEEGIAVELNIGETDDGVSLEEPQSADKFDENIKDETEDAETPVKFETEGSTIFVKHEYMTKKPIRNGWKKRIGICALALLLCACIGASAFLVIKLVPNVDNTAEIPSVTSQESIKVLDYSTYVKETVVETEAGDLLTSTNISGAGIYNYYEEYAIMPYTDEVATGENETTECIKWYIQGLKPELTLTDSLHEHLSLCMNIYATAKMENTYSSVEEYHKAYGLDNESCTRAFYITFNDGTESLEIMVGKQIASRDGNYLKVSGDDTVYIVSSTYIAYYDYLPSHFADLEMLPAIEENTENTKYFTTGTLSRFDHIKISGKVLKDKSYEFGMSTDVSADYMPYVMTSPYRRPASEDFLENILAFAQDGITADGLYSFNATDENREMCGLNDPGCVIEAKIGDYSFRLIIGGLMSEDSTGLAAMIEGKQQIFSIDAETLDFVDPEITSMFNYNFIMEDIYEIDAVTFENETGKHSFDLTHTPRDGNNNAYDTEVVYKGEKLNDSSFKALYQRVLLLSLLSFVIEEEKTEPVLTVTFEYIGDFKDRVVEFTESPRDSYHYVAWIDGVPLGEVLKSSVTDITDNLANYVAGGVVESPL